MEDIFFIAGGSQICLNLHTGLFASGKVVGRFTRGLGSVPLSLGDWNMNFDDDAIKLNLPLFFLMNDCHAF